VVDREDIYESRRLFGIHAMHLLQRLHYGDFLVLHLYKGIQVIISQIIAVALSLEPLFQEPHRQATLIYFHYNDLF
jgi:hypothetical protein